MPTGVPRPRFGPSPLRRWLAGGPDWQLVIEREEARLTVGDDAPRSVPFVGVRVSRRIWGSSLTAGTGTDVTVLSGFGHRAAGELQRTLDAAAHSFTVGRLFVSAAGQILDWWSAVGRELDERQRWITREITAEIQARRPQLDRGFLAAYADPDLAELIAAQPLDVHEAIRWWHTDLGPVMQLRNEQFLVTEQQRYSEFFRTVERSPLTPEQAAAVICFDSRLQLVASAGSGKTSTMIGKAGYALHRGIVPAERILLLAFNREAARELAQRVTARLGPDLHGEKVVVKTFHAFGLDIIGQATGRKPRVASWEGNGEGRVQEIVNELKEKLPEFANRWGLFTSLFADDLAPFDDDQAATSTAVRRGEHRTFANEWVKSQEEQLIANWLFLHQIRYVYERPYEHLTADAEHGQYHPDFYYPDLDVYHEHWAVGRNGRPPPHFEGYLDSMRWKRALHTEHATVLWETTSATVRDGTAFGYLTDQFAAAGQRMSPDFSRLPTDRPLMADRDLVHLLRSLMVHAKNNQLSLADLAQRAAGTRSPVRGRLFLELFAPVLAEWNKRLRAANEVDFADMISAAADHVEGGRWASPFQLVMIDEMQDVSRGQARLARVLVAEPGTSLFAVGDDWQSINRFAGADLSVMTDFHGWFGPGQTRRLETTFRSPQSLCDIAGALVAKNAAQIRKRVRSGQPEFPPTVQVVTVPSNTRYAAVIIEHLEHLDAAITAGTIPPARSGKATVYVLGRYRRAGEAVAPALGRKWTNLEIRFSTVHGSKGLEADYVVIVGLVQGGFPSTVEDDPLLELAMPASDPFPDAEERRLFYVALTRARRSVLMLTVLGRESSFLLELHQDRAITLTDASGDPIQLVTCPRCRRGRLVDCTGKYGGFRGCSRFPRCRFTRKSPDSAGR